MDGLHEESMPEDEGDALLLAEVGDPVPAEEALDGDDEVLAVRLEGFEQLVALAGELAMEEGLAFLVEDAEVETLGVQVDAAVVLVLLGVESHRGLLWSKGLPSQTAYRVGRPKGGLKSVSRPIERTAKPPLIGIPVLRRTSTRLREFSRS